jgi:hypothetical protein
MSVDAWAGAGWGVAGGLTVALVITIWVLISVLGLLRKMSERPAPNDGADVLPLNHGHRAQRAGGQQ